MASDNGATGPETYREIIIGNLLAYRARRRLNQDDVVKRMRDQGFTNWHRPTMGRIEKGERRVTAEEIIGLAAALQTFPANLLSEEGISAPGTAGRA